MPHWFKSGGSRLALVVDVRSDSAAPAPGTLRVHAKDRTEA
jgi:hypothetical protein